MDLTFFRQWRALDFFLRDLVSIRCQYPYCSHERWRNSEEAFIEAKSSHTAPAPSNAKAASKPKVKKAPPMKGSVLTGQIRNRKGAVSVWDEPESLLDPAGSVTATKSLIKGVARDDTQRSSSSELE